MDSNKERTIRQDPSSLDTALIALVQTGGICNAHNTFENHLSSIISRMSLNNFEQ